MEDARTGARGGSAPAYSDLISNKVAADLRQPEARVQPAFAQIGFGAAAFTRNAREGWWACLDSNQEPDRYERLKAVMASLKTPTIVAF